MNNILKEDAIQVIESNNGLKEIYNTKFLITGATGMIGLNFVNTILILNELYNANIKLYLLVRNKNKLPAYVTKCPEVNLIIQDVVEPIKCNIKVDYIIHTASPASPLIMKDHPVETNFANTIGTANALNYAKYSNVKCFMFISSREIYGQPEEDQEYFYENGKYGQLNHLIPRNGYAESKKAAENMCTSFKEEYGLNTKIVRLAHTYGPGMGLYDGRVQADFLKNIVNHENIILKSKGEAIRSYTYISDAITAMFNILLHSKDVVYNVADEKNKTSIKELAETLISIYPDRNLKLEYDIPKENINTGCSTFTHGILSTKKIKEELNWDTKYSIYEGFKRTIEYLESELQKDE